MLVTRLLIAALAVAAACAIPFDTKADDARDMSLIGCNAFKSRLNQGISIFADVLPPIQWKSEASSPGNFDMQRIMNFPETESVIKCDDNGVSLVSSGLYQDGSAVRLKWSSYVTSVLFALDVVQSEDEARKHWAILQDTAKLQASACGGDSDRSDFSIARSELILTAYRVTYTTYTYQNSSHEVAELEIQPRGDSAFGYLAPENGKRKRLTCDAVRGQLAQGLGAKIETRTFAHLRAERYAAFKAELLCDVRGKFLGLTSKPDKPDDKQWADWINTIAATVGATKATIKEAEAAADADLANDGSCPGEPKAGFGSVEIGSYSLGYWKRGEEKEISIDPY